MVEHSPLSTEHRRPLSWLLKRVVVRRRLFFNFFFFFINRCPRDCLAYRISAHPRRVLRSVAGIVPPDQLSFAALR